MSKFLAYLLAVGMSLITKEIYTPIVEAEYEAALLEETTVGYIYLGDSRFVGMNQYIHMDEMENTFVVAKVGEGLNWFKNTATDEILDIMEHHDDIDRWILISGLGINDYWNADSYIEYYDTWDDVEIIIVSANPVEEDKCKQYGYDYTNLYIGAMTFNDTIINKTDYPFIDTYSTLVLGGFSTVDGVHYDEKTYSCIYDVIDLYLYEYLGK